MIGQTISHYRIIQELGHGGMGVVYKAEDLRLGRFVALKFPSFQQSLRDADRMRLLREAQAASTINHPNVCVIHEIDEHDGAPFIVMEYVEGATLDKRIPAGGMRFDEVLGIATQVASGLAAAHANGIIHRDIKPENLMVREDGRVQIMDFGLAKLRTAPGVSMPGQTVGTALYMSPEQIEGSDIDARTDIFSLAVVLYQALTGRLPFEGNHAAAVMYAIVNTDPPPIETLAPGMPSELGIIVKKCLEKRPEDRYQSATELLGALRLCSESSRAAIPSGKIVSPQARLRIARWGFIMAALVATGFAVWGILALVSQPGRIDSLAILPLKNVSADTNLEYLSDGLTESIISKLSRLSTIKVMSRSSVFHFKGKDTDPETVGRTLGVRAVLTGDVSLREGLVTISVELLNTRDNTQIWGDQFRRKEAELVDLQDDISKEIVSNLQLRISPDEMEQINRLPTDNATAYETYLKGRYYWNLRTEADLKESANLFQQSINLDPRFALAYTGLAQAYAVMAAWGYMDGEEALRLTKTNARKALDIDDKLGEAHAALGGALDLQNDRRGALEEYRKAIELNPNDATSCQWYAEELAALRRFDESFVMIKRAQELDPLSLIIPSVGAVFYANAHQFDKAMDLARKSLKLDPHSKMGHLAVGLAYTRAGNPKAAIPELELGVAISDSDQTLTSWLGCAYALSGRRADAERIARRMDQVATQKYISPFLRALLATSLGQREKAFSLLDEGARTRDGWMQQLYEEIMFEPLRSDPKFSELARKLGFTS